MKADFLKAKGRAIGEFQIELKCYPKEQTDFQLYTNFILRHDALLPGRRIEAVLNNESVVRGKIEKRGKLKPCKEHLVTESIDPTDRDRCRVLCEGHAICRTKLGPD